MTLASPLSHDDAAPLVIAVNDDASTRYLWRRILERAGYRVLDTWSGAEALELCAEHHPDLVVLDVRLPDLLGFEVCRRLKADPATADVLVLQSSALLVTPGMKVEGLDSGADGYLAQPFEPPELVATVRALLRTRSAERRAQQARDVWHLTFDAMADGIALLDADLRVDRVNAALSRLAGRPAESLRGLPASVFASLIGLEPLPFEAAARGEGPQAREIEIGGRWHLARVEPIEGRNATHLLLLVSDDHARRELATAQQRRVDAMAEMDRRKDEFLAMLAHELRNPIGALTTALHLLEADEGPRRDRARQVAARQLRHLGRLVNDLLDVSRISRGRVELRREACDLAAIVEGAVRSVAQNLGLRGQGIAVRIEPGSTRVWADPVRIEQVVVNLVTNAAKYSPADTPIEVRVVPSDAEVRIRVRDRGIGLAQEDLEAVFDLFWQAETTLARSAGGLGIGLTLVRDLVELHGGRVAASSDGRGEGSTFEVVLPRAEVGSPPTPPPEASAAETRPLRIVVVEDNPDAREMLSEFLEACGHVVDTAPDGVTGLDRVLGLVPDAAFVDIGLPGLDGYQLAANVRAAAEGRRVYLVALTGYGRPEDRARALDAGFDAWIVKPVDPTQLERLLVHAPRRGADAVVAGVPPADAV